MKTNRVVRLHATPRARRAGLRARSVSPRASGSGPRSARLFASRPELPACPIGLRARPARLGVRSAGRFRRRIPGMASKTARNCGERAGKAPCAKHKASRSMQKARCAMQILPCAGSWRCVRKARAAIREAKRNARRADKPGGRGSDGGVPRLASPARCPWVSSRQWGRREPSRSEECAGRAQSGWRPSGAGRRGPGCGRSA